MDIPKSRSARRGVRHSKAEQCGAVVIASGVDGSELWRWRSSVKNGRAGQFLATASDMDGDGVRDLIVAGPGPDSHVTALSLGKRSLLWSVQTRGAGIPPALPCGDVDGDGLADVALIDHGSGIRFARGINGAEYARRTSGNAETGAWYSIALAPDLDGDGLPEFVRGHQGPGITDRRLRDRIGRRHRIIEGRFSGSPDRRWTIDAIATRSALGPRVRMVSDHSGDGRDDVLIWSRNHKRRRAQDGPALVLLNGVDGKQIATLKTPADATGNYGAALSLRTVQGVSTLVLGAPDQDPPRVEILPWPNARKKK